MLNIKKDFGNNCAVGDGIKDDTKAIQNAIAEIVSGVAHNTIDSASLYFPNGTYRVTRGINLRPEVAGKKSPGIKIFGEPALYGPNSGTVIKVDRKIKGGVLYSDPPTMGKATHPLELTHITIDANLKAENGLYLFGKTGGTYISQVIVMNSLSDGFLFDSCQVANFFGLKSIKAGGNGIHLIDCNGAKLTNFKCDYSGFRHPGNPNFNSYGLFIEGNVNSGGVFVQNGDIEHGYGSAIYIKNTLAITAIEKIWIENKQPPDVNPWYNVVPSDVVVLDGCRNVLLQKCRIGGGLKSADPDIELIRAIRTINHSYNNVIRDNFISVDKDPNIGGGLTSGDIIEIEGGNRVENNLTFRETGSGIPILAKGRNHCLGQRCVISYSETITPEGETFDIDKYASSFEHGWQIGDIIFNSTPNTYPFIGWVCTKAAAGDKYGTNSKAEWKTFGSITQ